VPYGWRPRGSTANPADAAFGTILIDFRISRTAAAPLARSKDMSDPTDEHVQFDAIIAQYGRQNRDHASDDTAVAQKSTKKIEVPKDKKSQNSAIFI
jgi:hypothetical protein